MDKFESLNFKLENEKEELLSVSFVNKLKTSLRERLDPTEDQGQADQMRALIDMKMQRLQAIYLNWQVYQTYYILSGQPVPESITKVDFPGDDSVIKFIENF